jgi:hypothetical protein
MRYTLLLFTLLSLTTFNCGQITTKDELKKIKDLKIELITGSTVVIENGIINTESSQNFITIINDRGQVVESRNANIRDGNSIIYRYSYGVCEDYERLEWLQWRKSDGKIDTIQIQRMTFDKNCKTKKIVWTDSTGKHTDTRIFEYNNEGKKISEVDLNSKNEKTSFVLYYYPDNSTVEKKAFFGDSSFWYHNKEYFDKNGKNTGYDSFDKNGNKTDEGEKVKFIYKDDKLIEEIHSDANGQIKFKMTYLYNSDNQVERTVTKSGDSEDEVETISIMKYKKRK